MSLKSKIKLLQKALSFAIMEVKWNEPTKYGLLSPLATFKKPASIANGKQVYLHDYSRLQAGARIINYTGKFIIKKYAACGENLVVVTGNHTPTVGIPQFFIGESHINDIERDIIVEEGAWVGVNCTLLSGAKIGRGAVIGANSMVNKEIPPYAVAVGSPARIIASVFSLDEILEHEKIVYKAEERFSKEFLQELFSTEFEGLRSIGTAVIKDEDKADADRVFEKIIAINETKHNHH